MSASLHNTVMGICRDASCAAAGLALAGADAKNRALHAIADRLASSADLLKDANAKDVSQAEAAGLSAAMVDRLRLDDKRIAAMAQGAREVAALPDPIGETMREWTRPNGLHITKRRVPIGVIGIIYESRPNVTCDSAVLCLKSGNATVLRGGSEAFESNKAIASVMSQALGAAGLPPASVQLIPTTDRAAITELCSMNQWVDLLIPRGGHGLIETVVAQARMPVIKHYQGICHVFVHAAADFEMAEKIIINSKCQRPGVCNALETLLVDRAVASAFLPRIAAALRTQGVELRGCEESRAFEPDMIPATEQDWSEEYLDLILSVRVVDGVAGAVSHISRYGSKHSDSIVTGDAQVAQQFVDAVDSSAVYWNASTRFTDGGEFGFGAEIGISTDKIHARGPMGLEELTSYKYVITGTGQIR